MSGGFWTGRGWELAEAGAICVLFLILGLWFGLRGRDRAYDEGYDDGQADVRDEYAAQQAGRLVASQARTAALLAVAVREPEPPGLTAVREAGYAVWDRRAELWARQVPEVSKVDTSEEWAVPLEFPPDPEPLYELSIGAFIESVTIDPPDPAFPPWSLLDASPPTLEEEVRAMIANANAAPSVRWLDSLEMAGER
jgi:hypothetical protein